MAVTVTQQPTSPNAAYTKLLYALSGSGTTSNQDYQYIMDIYESGSAVLLSRSKSVPNNAGIAVFNPSIFIQDYLTYDNNWNTTESISNVSSSKVFTIKFGEEYTTGSYPTASTVIDAGLVSTNIAVFKGTIDPTELNSLNFNADTFGTASVEGTSSAAPFNSIRGVRLSNNPYGGMYSQYSTPVSSSDYETITILSGYEIDSVYVFVDYDISSSFQFITGSTLDANLNTTIPVGPAQLGITDDFIGYTVSVILKENDDTYFSSTYVYSNINLCNEVEGNFTIASNQVSTGWVTISAPLTSTSNNSGAGNKNSFISTGGGTTSAPVLTSQEYNGFSWSSGGSLSTSHVNADAAGTQNAAIIAGGYIAQSPIGPGTKANAETYDGATWSPITSMNVTRAEHTLVGTQNAAKAIGGRSFNVSLQIVDTVENWNGSAWANAGVLPGTKASAAGGGGVNDAIVFGGNGTGTGTYTFNGTTWDTQAGMVLQTNYMRGGGNQSDAISFGNQSGPVSTQTNTQFYDGISWSTGGDMNFGRYNHGGDSSTSTSKDALAVGGATNPLTAEVYGGVTYTTQSFNLNGSNNQDYGATRFAFINQYGVWDYYNITNPITKSTGIERQSVITPNVDYNISTPVTSWSVSNRGNQTYHIKYQDRYQVTTDYLDQNLADWLTELIESPEVFLQQNYSFVPIVITNASYQWKTNPRGQKVFQYTVEFAYSNNRTSVY